MTTNPENIVRVRARNGGRASVYEANGWAQAFSTGVMDGDGVRQNTSADMSVLVGGTTSNPDVVIAKNPADYKIALDIVGTHTVAITAPAANKRIASVVAYTDDLSIQSTETSITGSPSTCGLIVVNGETSSSPVPPDDTAIRAAITADGATGTQASYAVIADIAVDSSTSVITDNIITNHRSGVTSGHVDFATIKDEANEMPVATTDVNTGLNGLHFILSRVGSLVFVHGQTTAATNLVSRTSDYSCSGTIPEGFRPTATDFVTGEEVYNTKQSSYKSLGFSVYPNGSILAFISADIDSQGGNIRFGFSGVWVTNDPWPGD